MGFDEALVRICNHEPTLEDLTLLLRSTDNQLTELINQASDVRELGGREVSYSRNVFLPITNLCRNRCWYCGFRRDPGDSEAWFMSLGRVAELLERARDAACSEALFTLGERPEVHAEVGRALRELGYEMMIDYLEDLCQFTLSLGLLPHTNVGVISEREMRRLRRLNASMGLMLECAADLPAHRDSPGKDPLLRLEVIETAGKLRVPFTTGLLIGIGESFEDRALSLLSIKKIHDEYGHIQEIIIQNFVPKPNTPMANCPGPSIEELLAIVATARLLMPEMNIQVPPNLLDFKCGLETFLLAGANDLGGISSVTPDFINPDHPWPSVVELRASIERAGFVPCERLPIYPRYARNPKFMSREVRKVVQDLADENGYRRG
ncbi:MAG: 7,8-didemethyl-8-hydroxy-5-deazariboflavin synthase CofG [Candidatus Hodarchaeaceae archaeon]|nr:7,8-didemethyl-8-hydroxy-5-deazariboflavin synthase CofG [Candidatus Hodarchaeaceae archaeon]